mgnify:CR=1 FL=1
MLFTVFVWLRLIYTHTQNPADENAAQYAGLYLLV